MSSANATGAHKRRNSSTMTLSCKRLRYEASHASQVVPNLDAAHPSAALGGTPPLDQHPGSGASNPHFGASDDLDEVYGFAVPKAGTPVNRKVIKRVGGKYLLGPKIGNGVEAISQYLVRRENTDQYFQLKMLVLSDPRETCKKVLENEKQIKFLLHSEYQLLRMLENEEGIIRAYDLFTDYALEEEPVADRPSEYVYTGNVKKRIVLVVDCLSPHDFDEKANVFINLQQYVIREKNLTENKTLLVFYEIIKIVESLHKKNIVHRDLKLRNIVLNMATNKVIITNFCLGKFLLNENDYLHDQRGSPAYISPEVLSASHQNPYKGKPSDIWSLGVVLFTMLYSQFPFFETKPAALFKRIKSVDYKIPKHTKVSEGTQFLIKNMLVLEPEERLTATEIREHIERMINDKRQFFLRIDQVVPDRDMANRTKAAASVGEAIRTKDVPELMCWTRPLSMPVVDLTRPPPPPSNSHEEGIDMPRVRLVVQRAETDARMLTAEESQRFSNIIRQHSANAAQGNASMASHRVIRMPNSATLATTSHRHATGSTASRQSTSGSGYMPINQQMSNLSLWHRLQHMTPSREDDHGSGAAAATATNAGGPLAASDLSSSQPMALTTTGSSAAAQETGMAARPNSLPTRPTATPVAQSCPRRMFLNRLRRLETISNFTGRVPNVRLFSSSETFSMDYPMVSAISSAILQSDEAALAFYHTLNDMFSRGRIPVRASEDQLTDFNGELTTELAEEMSRFLLQDCSDSVIVRDIFAESTVNAREKVLELLRRCGVQIENGPANVEIKRSQTLDSVILLSYLLQASGYNNTYFA